MADTVHFVQSGDEPVLVSPGDATLACRSCGHTLVQGFDPLRFVAIGIRCARCGTVTTTAPFPEYGSLAESVIVAQPSDAPRQPRMPVPPEAAIFGEAEMQRVRALCQPAPADNLYRIDDALLDRLEAEFLKHTGTALPVLPPARDRFDGLRDHPLAWSLRVMRERLARSDWDLMNDRPMGNALTHVLGFLHFAATWSRHPMFPPMLTTVEAYRFSLHGLAPFAAADCLVRMGNQIHLREFTGFPARIEALEIVAGDKRAGVEVQPFAQFEYPLGKSWTTGTLRGAFEDAVNGVQGRINRLHPGLLVLSPGSSVGWFDEAFLNTVNQAVPNLGRRNPGLIGVAPVVLRWQFQADPRAVRFGYGFTPVLNPHYRGDFPILPPGAAPR